MVTKTIIYIENHYTGDLTLGQVAEEFNVTPNHLSSLFSQTYRNDIYAIYNQAQDVESERIVS